MVKTLLASALLIPMLAIAAETQPLREGTYVCEDKHYESVALTVRRHPTKPHKAIVNWEGRDRILHNEPTESGALRYVGAVSKIVYIQAAYKSVLLDDNTMKPILTDCFMKKG